MYHRNAENYKSPEFQESLFYKMFSNICIIWIFSAVLLFIFYEVFWILTFEVIKQCLRRHFFQTHISIRMKYIFLHSHVPVFVTKKIHISIDYVCYSKFFPSLWFIKFGENVSGSSAIYISMLILKDMKESM